MKETMFNIPLWASIPFVIMLLAIAIGPLVAEHWWEKNKNKLIVSLVLGIPTATYLIINGMGEHVTHTLLFDYIPFIILLLTLFVITGGIDISGDIKAKPSINTLFLGIGYILLIRPIIRTNSERKYVTHTILFFIAVVANCGGLLTPLGDPPLFMLYLRGVEFTWFLKLLPEWAFTGALLLSIYYIVDKHFYKKEDWVSLAADSTEIEPIRITGKTNLLLLIGVVLSVAYINPGTITPMGNENAPIWLKFLREYVLIALVALSLFLTKKEIRKKNIFTWGPIIEVGYLFLGIFITMTPTLIYLTENAANLGIKAPWQFYYSTGMLSSFLDNTPTAVAFYNLALGLVQSGLPDFLANSPMVGGVPEILLKAICTGAVFFGSMTYIGNGPNFMVKSIAEENKIKMPSFFGYMTKFSLIVLLPIFILTQILFI